VARGASKDALKLVKKALALAKTAPSDAASGPVGHYKESLGGLGTRDRRYSQLERSDRLDVLLAAERGARTKDRRVTTTPFEYEDSERSREYVNSRGVALSAQSTYFRAAGGLRVSSLGLDLSSEVTSRSFASIASIPFGTQLGMRAVKLMEPVVKLGNGPVTVALGSLATAKLVARLGEEFHPSRLVEGKSFLLSKPADEALFDRRIHIIDDGALPGGLRTRGFDDRGVPPVGLTLVREGHVVAWPLDPELARKQDTRATGHCIGDDLRVSNLRLRTGTRSLRAHQSELEIRMLVVDDIPDFSGFDPRSGDVRVVVNGRMMSGKNEEGPVRNITLSGNLMTILNQIVAVASDTDRYGHVDAPAMIVNGFTAE
jgi:predicted Zn-dependent protease